MKKRTYTSNYFDQIALEYLATKDKNDLRSRYEQDKIIKKLSYLVEMRASRYLKYSNVDDLRQVGYEGLLMALDTFQMDRSAFSYWANRYIQTRMSRSACLHSAIKIPLQKAKMEKPIKVPTLPQISIVENPENLLEQKRKLSALSNIITQLPQKEQDLLSSFYGFTDLDFDSTCIKYQLDRKSALKIVKSARNKIKQNFSNLDM